MGNMQGQRSPVHLQGILNGIDGYDQDLYKLLDVESSFRCCSEICINEDVLITPFYVDESMYELHSFEMNLIIEDGSGTHAGVNESMSRWLVELRKSLTLYKATSEKPYVPASVLQRYFEFLRSSYLVKSEIVTAFKKAPEIEKIFLAFY